ncbi:MAG TPA: hypothetical protein VFO86_14305, partial [Terriglobia bacterium]|nr:hypothetical protein [Terriglobia bacterium]
RSLIVSALIIALVFSFVLEAQDSRKLYLVTGYTTTSGPQKVASNLFKVDPISHDFEFVTELIPAGTGSLSTNVDHERGVVALMSGSGEAVTFSTNTPGVIRRFPILHDGFQTLASFVDVPGGKVALALETQNSSGKQSLIGIDVVPLQPTAKPVELPWKSYESARTEGSWSPGDQKRHGGGIELRVRNGKTFTTQIVSFSDKRINEVELSVPTPREAATPSDGRAWRILINNDEISALLRLFDKDSGTDGKMTLYIFNKKSRAWHTEDFDGELSSFRGFGSWIAVNQAEANYVVINGMAQPKPVVKESPGKSERQQILDPQDNYRDQVPIDSIFENYYPGIISLYDVRSGKRYRLDTGQGDTEVLLVDGKTIYYRVNDTLFRAEIGQSAIQNPIEIARDGNFQFAHWAFLSSK